MAFTFYGNACELDTKNSPWVSDINSATIEDTVSKDYSGLTFHYGKNSKLLGPHSIMNDHVAINYRTIYNGFAMQEPSAEGKQFTQYSDYLKCMTSEKTYREYLELKKNPTYENIMRMYNTIDNYGMSRYKLQDFIYLKYFNQIPNNYMITLRRYVQPCQDHMFGLDMGPEVISDMYNYPAGYCAIATAVTYMGEQTGNKLSDILKFEYGMNWEDKTAEVQSLQSSDSGLAGQMKQRAGISADFLSGQSSDNPLSGSSIRQGLVMSAMSLGKGVSVNQAMASQYNYEGNAFSERYGDQFYGDLNVIQNAKIRSRGLTFSNKFSLTFEYSLKSLKTVNPRVAMIDILCNFLILTGNYGSFWGGATLFFGNRNIAPQYGDPSLLRQGKYGEYMTSLWKDVKEGFSRLSSKFDSKEGENSSLLDKLLNIASNIVKGGATALLGNIFGGKIGVAGSTQVPRALLSGEPAGYWHVTVGNPLDPIAMMGNMAVTNTSVQFNDVLGYDDFPTEIKFTVDLEHCRPRDNAFIESMFNGGKGRFYSFTNGDLENAYHAVDWRSSFKGGGNSSQEANVDKDGKSIANHTSTKWEVTNEFKVTKEKMKIIGSVLNN